MNSRDLNTLLCSSKPVIDIKTLYQGALFIVSNGTDCQTDIPSYWKYRRECLQQKFNFIIQCGENYKQFCFDLIESFLDLYKISLHIIVHNNGEQFITINKEYFLSSDHHLIIHYTPYHALMLLNIDKGDLLPYYSQENNERRTIFTENPTLNHSLIQRIVDQLRETRSSEARDFVQTAATFAKSDSQKVYQPDNADDNAQITELMQTSSQSSSHSSTLNNQSYSIPSQLPVTYVNPERNKSNQKSTKKHLIDTTETNNGGSLKKKFASSTHETMSILPLPTLNRNSSNDKPNSSSTLTIEDVSRAARIPNKWNKPEILNQPKEEWNCRYLSDLKMKVSKPTELNESTQTCVVSNKDEDLKTSIPLIQGCGDQRFYPRVKISNKPTVDQNYLACTVLTVNNAKHPLKLVVPKGTTFDESAEKEDNDLKALNTTRCDPNHHLDIVKRNVYLLITPEDHRQGYKDILLHLVNLKRTFIVKQEISLHAEVDKCYLAFWFCDRPETSDEEQLAISTTTVIIDKKKGLPKQPHLKNSSSNTSA